VLPLDAGPRIFATGCSAKRLAVDERNVCQSFVVAASRSDQIAVADFVFVFRFRAQLATAVLHVFGFAALVRCCAI
jgi:hypothetical protein